MCFYFKQSSDATSLENRFNARFVEGKSHSPSDLINGFSFPQTPVVTNDRPEMIQMFSWGLLPHWAKDISSRKNTLNARWETVSEKPSFKNSVTQRCLILADGFYEWQWLDEKGKKKQKYLISLPDGEPFAFAGLWNHWQVPASNERMSTYTILTTGANPQMATIHNSKKRMPCVLTKETERLWLEQNEKPEMFDVEFLATKQ